MKKMFLIAACTLMANGAFAQVKYGVKAGLNLAEVTKTNASMKPGFYAGAFAEFNVINDILAIQPELVYSRQGACNNANGIKSWMRLNYINIPVMAKLSLVDNLTLDLGPQFGFNINGKLKTKADGTTVKSKIDGIKTFDMSVGMGLSYKFAEMFDVSARYNLGLTKINEGPVASKNGVIQLGVGYWF